LAILGRGYWKTHCVKSPERFRRDSAARAAPSSADKVSVFLCKYSARRRDFRPFKHQLTGTELDREEISLPLFGEEMPQTFSPHLSASPEV
jgi:hypothetical protein